MRLLPSFAALLVALSLTACSAPAPAPETPQTATSTPAPVPSTTPAPPAAPQPPPSGVAAPVPAPPLVERPGNANPMSPDRACRTDADCAVKDVGSCCGTFPLCVNKDAKIDPAAVRAQCAKTDMASVCGFPPVSGCTCAKGRCENVVGRAEVM
jgi:hypothetical protein